MADDMMQDTSPQIQTCPCGCMWDAGPAWREGSATMCPACHWRQQAEKLAAAHAAEREYQRQVQLRSEPSTLQENHDINYHAARSLMQENRELRAHIDQLQRLLEQAARA